MSSQALVPMRKKSSTNTTEPLSSQESPSPKSSETTEAVKAETDQLLDEIDRVLDQDAIAKLREELADKPAEDKPLTLSDLMREGSTVTDQAIGAWTRPTGETCALSAAMLAARARKLA